MQERCRLSKYTLSYLGWSSKVIEDGKIKSSASFKKKAIKQVFFHCWLYLLYFNLHLHMYNNINSKYFKISSMNLQSQFSLELLKIH